MDSSGAVRTESFEDLSAGALTAVILAGGIGSRLRDVTTTPKPLVPVDGRPLLFYLLEALKYQGIARAIICTGYRSEVFEGTLRPWNPGLDLVFSAEAEPLGTGGALRLAARQINSSHALVLNGDSWCDFDLTSWLRSYAARANHPSLLAAKVEDVGRYGSVEMNDEGRVSAFREKQAGPGSGWSNAGVYLLPVRLLRELPETKPLSLEREVMSRWITQGLFAFRSEAPFLDIGIPESYAEKETFFRDVREARQRRVAQTMFSLSAVPRETQLKIGVGVLLLNDAGEILLERRADCGLWGLIGGAMQPGESAPETALREIREETGLAATIIGLRGVYSQPSTHLVRYPDRGDVKHLFDIVVEARLDAGQVRPSAESDELRFFRKDALPPEAEIILPAREPLRDWVAGRRPVLD